MITLLNDREFKYINYCTKVSFKESGFSKISHNLYPFGKEIYIHTRVFITNASVYNYLSLVSHKIHCTGLWLHNQSPAQKITGEMGEHLT